MSIYVIDDHPLMRDAIVMVLRRLRPAETIVELERLDKLASAVKQMHMDQSPGGRKTLSDVANGTPGPDNGAARILRENGVTDPGEQAAAAQQADKMLGPIDPQQALPW